MSTSTEITLLPKLPEKAAALAVFKEPDGLAPFVEHVRNAVMGMACDVSTTKGRAEIKSTAFAITRSKTALDNLGKEVVDELKALPKQIDANRKVMRDQLDELAKSVRKPLTDWEQAEDKRKRDAEEAKAKLDAAIQKIADAGSAQWGTPAAALQERIQKLESLSVAEQAWGSREHASRAEKARDASLDSLRKMLKDRQEFERQQHELNLMQEQAVAQSTQQPATEKPNDPDPAPQAAHAAAAGIPFARGLGHESAQTQQAAITPSNAPASTQRTIKTSKAASPCDLAAAALQQIVGLDKAQAIAVVNAVARGEIPYLSVDAAY